MIQTNIQYCYENQFQGNLKKAMGYLLKNYEEIKIQELGTYEIDPDFFYMVQSYDSKDEGPWESHRKYIDIQLILQGEEIIHIAPIYSLKNSQYDEERDWVSHEGEVRSILEMHKGDIAIFYPEDAHQPGLKTKNGSVPVKKCLFKVAV